MSRPMGVMHFLVPRRDRVGADAAQRAYFAGIDEVPWLSRIQWNEQGLVVQRAEFDSGNFYIPYVVDGRGELMLSTASLMERAQPYHLHVELARGTLNRLRNQVAAFAGTGAALPASLEELLHRAHEQLSSAVTRKDEPEEAARLADLTLETTLAAVDLLSETYARQMIATRRVATGRLTTLLGVNLGSTLPSGDLASQLDASFNTVQVPLAWRDIEAREGQPDFSLPDAQIDWARSAGFKVCGGPLLAMDKGALPDWMYLFGEDDVDNFRSCVAEHIQAVVARYRGKVHLWICSAGLNLENEFEHPEEERLRLAVLTIECIRRQDPRAPIVLSVDQPWGAFMSREEYDLSPLHFADALVRADLGLAGIGLQIDVGYAPGGSEPRDALEFGRQMDRYSTLGLPLLVSLTVPSASTPDPRARRKSQVIQYSPGESLTPATQRAWGEQILPMLLAKQAVQGILWNQLLDSQPHALRHGGLYDDHDQAKPIVELLQRLRRENLA
jgi:hypothetical protein